MHQKCPQILLLNYVNTQKYTYIQNWLRKMAKYKFAAMQMNIYLLQSFKQ